MSLYTIDLVVPVVFPMDIKHPQKDILIAVLPFLCFLNLSSVFPTLHPHFWPSPPSFQLFVHVFDPFLSIPTCSLYIWSITLHIRPIPPNIRYFLCISDLHVSSAFLSMSHFTRISIHPTLCGSPLSIIWPLVNSSTPSVILVIMYYHVRTFPDLGANFRISVNALILHRIPSPVAGPQRKPHFQDSQSAQKRRPHISMSVLWSPLLAVFLSVLSSPPCCLNTLRFFHPFPDIIITSQRRFFSGTFISSHLKLSWSSRSTEAISSPYLLNLWPHGLGRKGGILSYPRFRTYPIVGCMD